MGNTTNIYDVIIIGSGPAGMTAGIYSARREMKSLIIGKELGGQVSLASEIENYPGFQSIQALDLVDKIKKQTENLGVEIISGEVKEIKKGDNEIFTIKTERETYQSRTVIIAIGLSPRRLAIKGEEEFTGRGVSYCANCDGPFFKDKIVSVVGGGNAALDAAEVLSKIAKKVYLIHRRQEFTAFEALVNEVKSKENIEMVLDAQVDEIAGESKVEKIIVKSTKDSSTKEIQTDGVFIEIGRIASTDLVANLTERNDRNQIIVDEKCNTKTKGLFAAGDVTNVPFKQITIACGQATIAALSAYQYIQLKDGHNKTVIIDRSSAKK